MYLFYIIGELSTLGGEWRGFTSHHNLLFYEALPLSSTFRSEIAGKPSFPLSI